jgi:transposase
MVRRSSASRQMGRLDAHSAEDFKQFRNAKQFGGRMGLVPSQNSSGGKARLGGIAKRGDQ